jgi:hypothetical protein
VKKCLKKPSSTVKNYSIKLKLQKNRAIKLKISANGKLIIRMKFKLEQFSGNIFSVFIINFPQKNSQVQKAGIEVMKCWEFSVWFLIGLGERWRSRLFCNFRNR